MKLAVISDIHGNLPAFRAAVGDARANGADGFIFVGDYCLSNPYPDECLSFMREIGGWALRGNEEGYIEKLARSDQSAWTDGQMQISYWTFRQIRPENRAYLLSLPDEIALRFGSARVFAAHSSEAFIGKCEHENWCTSAVANKYVDGFITKERLEADIRASHDANAKLQTALERLESGVYIFGHSHVQWSYASKDGKKLLVNPGSCGLPLDFINGGAPYAMIDIGADISVELRRADFDFNNYVEEYKQTALYTEVRVWSDVIIEELRSRRETLYFFLEAVKEYAEATGDKRRPYAVETWEGGYRHWRNGHSSAKVV